ncbi:MAG: hypothetical protein HYS12_10205 [Planctomycetes bacterium]|nr:hypothetical protein [Planctomycetota bacterium]
MRGLAGLLLVLAAGCSTAPLADVLDFACPPRMPPPNAPSFGGVGVPPTAPPPAAIVLPPVSVPVPVPALPAEPPVPVVPPQ